MRLRPMTSTYYPETGSTTPPPAAPVTGPVCHACGLPLRPDGPSEWYCGDDCQTVAMRSGADRPNDVLDRPDMTLATLAWLRAGGADRA